MAVSSSDLDKLVLSIKRDIDTGSITSIPQSSDNFFMKNADQVLSESDRNIIIGYIEDYELEPYELEVFSEIVSWNIRNTSASLKSLLTAVGHCLKYLIKDNPEDTGPLMCFSDVTVSNMLENFQRESPDNIRRIMKSAVVNGPISAKIPLYTHAAVIQDLISPKDTEKMKADLSRYLAITDAKTNLSSKSMSAHEYVARLLIQTCKSVSEYKQDESFSNLRSFLNNAGHICTLVRIYSEGSQDETSQMTYSRLACDINDQVHSLDRLLSSNAILARQLLSRMVMNEEIIYSHLVDFARHQHRIISVEGYSILTMFAYLVKMLPKSPLSDNQDISKSINRMFRFTDINTKYINEVSVNQGN